MGKDIKGKELGKGIAQRKDGRYCGRYADRFGIRREVYDSNLAKLRQKLTIAIYDDINHRNTTNSSITLSEWYHEWMDIHKYKVIRDSTKLYYETVFRKHIEPTLGKYKLKDITQLEIRKLIKALDVQGYKFETQNKVRIMLTDMYDKAIIDDLTYKNPARGIKIVRDEEKQIRFLTRKEQTEFFDCSKGTFYDNLFVVAVLTGLRQGELCALTWDDVDFENKEISVSKTLLYQKLEGDEKKEFHIHPPKTKTSYRKVPINKQCELALKKQFVQRNHIMSKTSTKPVKGYENLLFLVEMK